MLPRARVRLAAANRKQTLSPPFSSQKPTTSSLTSPPASTPQIRFTRLGRIRKPFYRIIAIDSRKRRDGAPLEYLGWYDPVKKQSNLDAPAIKAWLGKGAQPSDTVRNLLKKSLIMD